MFFLLCMAVVTPQSALRVQHAVRWVIAGEYLKAKGKYGERDLPPVDNVLNVLGMITEMREYLTVPAQTFRHVCGLEPADPQGAL